MFDVLLIVMGNIFHTCPVKEIRKSRGLDISLFKKKRLDQKISGGPTDVDGAAIQCSELARCACGRGSQGR